MRIFCTAIWILLYVNLSVEAQSDMHEGMRWYQQRTEGAVGLKADPVKIDRAIVHFERAYKNGEALPESGVYLMRCYIFKARFCTEGNSEKRKVFQLAKELGDELVPDHPLNKELRFEYLSAIGQWGDVMGIFRAAKEGVADLVKKQMEALIRLDPEFRNGIGERALAVLNLRVPKIPFIISWPDKKRAVEMTADVLRRYPDDMGNNIYHAEALAENGKEQEAIRYLQRALTMQPNPEYLLEERALHKDAKQLLKRLKGE